VLKISRPENASQQFSQLNSMFQLVQLFQLFTPRAGGESVRGRQGGQATHPRQLLPEYAPPTPSSLLWGPELSDAKV
jgi:hypothetical protein